MLNGAVINKKTAFLGQFFCLLLAVPTGIVPAKRNYIPTDYELILRLFRCFSCKDLLILRADTETVKLLMANLLKVETNVHFCPLVSLRELFYFIYNAVELGSQHREKGDSLIENPA